MQVQIDFNEFQDLILKIKQLTYEEEVLELRVKFLEAQVVEEVSTNPKYFQNGKQPSMAYIESTWKFKGINNEIYEERLKLADIRSQLTEMKLQYDTLVRKFEMWRTESANQRKFANTLETICD